MKIIGVVGKKRSGKDTVAAMLGAGVRRIAFADKLKHVAMQMFGLSFEQCYGDDLKEVIDERWGLSPRVILQRIGTECARGIHKDVWIRNVFDTIEAHERGESVTVADFDMRTFVRLGESTPRSTVWCITDCRFPNEADAARAHGGVVVKVTRPARSSYEAADQHASETSIDDIVEDYGISNNGTLDDLRSKVEGFARWYAERRS